MGLRSANKTSFKKGMTPHNKGVESFDKIKKIKLFKEGKEIECKIHGLHNKWRLHTRNNIQCKICSTEWQRNRRLKNPIKFLLIDGKSHAKKKGLMFEINESDISELLIKQKGKCAISKITFSQENKFSLDRINPEKGYTLDNIQLLIFEINRMKSDINLDRFIQLCKFVSDNANRS